MRRVPPFASPAGACGDGISIGTDGRNWCKRLDLQGNDFPRSGDDLWRVHEYNLSNEIDHINIPTRTPAFRVYRVPAAPRPTP